jgi:YbbR domain-containing protein
LDPELKFQKNNLGSTDRNKVKFKKQLFIYLSFLFISVLFWYLNALSKTYYTQLSYSVYYVNYPKGKVLISGQKTNVHLLVKGVGFHLLRYQVLSYIRPIKIDLGEYSSQIRPTSNQYNYLLPSSAIRSKISSLFFNLQVYGIHPDTLRFSFTNVIDKKIAIKPALKLEFEKTYMLKGNIHVIPDSIIVSGPQAIIDTLKYITTKELQIEGIKDKVVAVAELIPIDRFKFPANTVKIYIPAEKFTEITYNIPIESENVPAGLEIKTFPTTISLSFNVALSDYDNMNASMFRAAVDYNNILESKPQKLKVTLIKSPSIANNIKYNPKSVEYLVEPW